MVMDPVCHMEVDERQATATTEYQGSTYYFCSAGCKRAFDREPQKYVTGQTQAHGGHH